mgnify:CR=1 FL=1
MRTLQALIIDDDESFRTSLDLLVQREGFATQTAGSLAEARLRLAAGTPDVVLVDLGLPDGDGLAWLRAEPGEDRDQDDALAAILAIGIKA